VKLAFAQIALFSAAMGIFKLHLPVILYVIPLLELYMSNLNFYFAE